MHREVNWWWVVVVCGQTPRLLVKELAVALSFLRACHLRKDKMRSPERSQLSEALAINIIIPSMQDRTGTQHWELHLQIIFSPEV